ncbi:MAG: hypothetical protein HOG95_18320, partial [Rhodospirillaceae bacterium]|nr:hypothetical protein [Rhodospirillaceae bacterium]
MNENSAIIFEIEKYCRDAGIAESTFGRRAVNDGKFVARLRSGKGVTTSTITKIEKFLQLNGIDQQANNKKNQKN